MKQIFIIIIIIIGFQHFMHVCHECQWNYKTGSFSIGISV